MPPVSEAQKRAAAAYQARLLAAGGSKFHLRLSPEVSAKLDEICKARGISRTAAINWLIESAGADEDDGAASPATE